MTVTHLSAQGYTNYCAGSYNTWEIKGHSKHVGMCRECSNIDTTVAHAAVNKYDWAYIFHTLWLLRPYNTSRKENLVYCHNPKTILHFWNMFDKILDISKCTALSSMNSYTFGTGLKRLSFWATVVTSVVYADATTKYS